MSKPKRNDLAQRTTATCNACKQAQPAAAFFPSYFAGYPEPLCRTCQKTKQHAKQAAQHAAMAAQLRAHFAGRVTWTGVEAAELLGYKPNSAGSLLEALCRQGHIARVAVGKYRFIDPPIAPERTAPMLRLVAPSEPAVQDIPASSVSVERGPLYLAIGPHHLINLDQIILRETDDRGNYTVMVSASDTNKSGITAPLVYQFSADDPRAIVTAAALVEGAQADLRRTVDDLRTDNETLRRELARAVADRDTWQTLAEEQREQTIAKIMQTLRAA